MATISGGVTKWRRLFIDTSGLALDGSLRSEWRETTGRTGFPGSGFGSDRDGGPRVAVYVCRATGSVGRYMSVSVQKRGGTV